jgi:hypothetical protein
LPRERVVMTASKGSSAKTGPKTGSKPNNTRTKVAKTIDVEAVDVTPAPEQISALDAENDSPVENTVEAASANNEDQTQDAPSEPVNTPSDEPKAKQGKAGGSLGLLLALSAGVVGGLGASVALPYLGVGGQPQQVSIDTTALSQFEASMAELEARVAALDEVFAQAGEQSSDVASAVGEISSQLRQEVSTELSALSQDLVSLKEQAAAASAAAAQKPDLAPEVASLESALKQMQQAQQSLQTQLDEVRVAQQNLAEQVTQNAQGIAQNAAHQAQIAAVMPVLSALESAVDEGGDVQGFKNALRGLGINEADLNALVLDDAPSKAALQTAINAVKAETMAFEKAAMEQAQADLAANQPAPDALEPEPAKTGIVAQLKSSFTGLVKVKRLNEPSPAPTIEAATSPAMQALNTVAAAVEAGDFSAALLNLQAANLPPSEAFLSLQNGLEQRQNLDAALDNLKAKLSAGSKQEG